MIKFSERANLVLVSTFCKFFDLYQPHAGIEQTTSDASLPFGKTIFGEFCRGNFEIGIKFWEFALVKSRIRNYFPFWGIF